MKAMILAAGLGTRLRPLTLTTPKPLVRVGSKPLIQWHLEALADAGFTDVVINVSWLAERLMDTLGDGSKYGLTIHYSVEPTPLETAGGIKKALPILGDEPFMVINGDIWTGYDFTSFPELIEGHMAHLVLVDNPNHHPEGDFSLQYGLVGTEAINQEDQLLTFAGIGVYHPRLFDEVGEGPAPLAPLLRKAMARRQVSGHHYVGQWVDVGTIERLENLNHMLAEEP